MSFYAQRPGRLAGQLLGDVFVLVWAVVWAVLGVVVDRTVSLLAAPARQTAETAERLSSNFSDAAGQAAQLPGLGEQLRRPFDAASGSLGDLVSSANQTVDTIHQIAALMGWMVFLIPVSLLVAFWLPRRIRFYRLAKAAQGFLDEEADLDLFALRAMATQPMHVLARISPDPVGAWRAGGRGAINQRAEG